MVAQCDKGQVRGGICAADGCKLDAIMPNPFFSSARDTSQDGALNDKNLKKLYHLCLTHRHKAHRHQSWDCDTAWLIRRPASLSAHLCHRRRHLWWRRNRHAQRRQSHARSCQLRCGPQSQQRRMSPTCKALKIYRTQPSPRRLLALFFRCHCQRRRFRLLS